MNTSNDSGLFYKIEYLELLCDNLSLLDALEENTLQKLQRMLRKFPHDTTYKQQYYQHQIKREGYQDQMCSALQDIVFLKKEVPRH